MTMLHDFTILSDAQMMDVGGGTQTTPDTPGDNIAIGALAGFEEGGVGGAMTGAVVAAAGDLISAWF